MQLPHRLLQIGTLALFAAMIGGLVFYQSGAVKQEQPSMVRDSVEATAWFDSVRFQKALKHAYISRFPSSKVAIVFKPVKTANAPKGSVEEFFQVSRQDTLRAIDMLRMRHEVAKLALPDALEFEMKCNLRRIKNGNWVSTEDSLGFWEQLKFHPQRVAQLSSEEGLRFRTILDSLPKPYGYDGLQYRMKYQVPQALKILAAEKWPR